jgi:hypothetical protein
MGRKRKNKKKENTMPPTAGDPAAPLDLGPARALASLGEVSRALQDVGAAERGIEADLDGLLAARAGLERDLARLADRTAEVRRLSGGVERAGLRGGGSSARHPAAWRLYPFLHHVRGWRRAGAGWQAVVWACMEGRGAQAGRRARCASMPPLAAPVYP